MASILDYDLPAEFNVEETKNYIQITLPAKIPQEVKDEISKQQLGDKSVMLIKPVQKKHLTFQYIGGNDGAKRIKFVLYTLEHMKDSEGKPLFQAGEHAFPIETLKFLSKDVKDGMSVDELKAIESLQYEKWTMPLAKAGSPDIKAFEEYELELNPTLAHLLVLIFAPKHIEEFAAPGNEKRLIYLGIPAKVPVAFQFTQGKYKVSFGPYGPHSAEDIRKQIDTVLSIVSEQKWIVADFSETDELDDQEIANCLPAGARFIRLLVASDLVKHDEDEEEDMMDVVDDEDELTDTRILVYKPNMTDDEKTLIKEKLTEFYAKNALYECEKCKLVYCPASETACYKFSHKGKLVPGSEEGGEDEDGNPVIYCRYTCCGECIMDEVPLNCHREPNGDHEKGKESSRFAVDDIFLTNE